MKIRNHAVFAVLMLFIGPLALFWAMDRAESAPTTLTSMTDLVLDKPLRGDPAQRLFLPWAEAISRLEKLVGHNLAIPAEGPEREDSAAVLRSVLGGGFLTSRNSSFPVYRALERFLKTDELAGQFISLEKRRLPFYAQGLARSAGPEYRDFLLFYSLLIRINDYGFTEESQLLAEAANAALKKVNQNVGRAAGPEESPNDEQDENFSGSAKKDYLMRAMAFAVVNVFSLETSGRTYTLPEIQAAADFFGYVEATEQLRIDQFYANRASWRTNRQIGLRVGGATAGLITLARWIGHVQRPYDPSMLTSFTSTSWELQAALTAIPSIAVGLSAVILSRGLLNPFWTELMSNRLAGVQGLCVRLLTRSGGEE